MKTLATISAALLFLFLAVSLPAFSQESDHPQTREEKPKNDEKAKSNDDKAPKPDNKAMKQDDRGMKQQDDRGMKQDEGKRGEERPETGKAVPARPDRRQEDHADRNHQQHQASAQRGQRIPDDKFRSHFGREHHFHVDRARIVNQSQPVVVYGGYSFQLIDAWPADWSYDDDCYIDYVDDGYYLFDALHPGIRIAVIVLG